MRRALYARLSQSYYNFIYAVAHPKRPMAATTPAAMTFMIGIGYVCAECQRHFFEGGSNEKRKQKRTMAIVGKPPVVRYVMPKKEELLSLDSMEKKEPPSKLKGRKGRPLVRQTFEGKKNPLPKRDSERRRRKKGEPPPLKSTSKERNEPQPKAASKKMKMKKKTKLPACKEKEEPLKPAPLEKKETPLEDFLLHVNIDELKLGSRRLMKYVEHHPELPELNAKTSAMFARLMEESDFSVVGATKLVDHPKYRRDWRLWNSLLAFRLRLQQDAGVKEIWKGIKARDLDLPTQEEEAQSMWKILVATALRDDSMADELIGYAHDHSERSNHQRQWAPLYDEFMLHHVVNLSEYDTVLEWHWRLFPVFTSQSWATFIAKAVKRQPSPRCHHLLRMIHRTLQRPGLYTTVIQDLCSKNMYREAFRWSKHFLNFDDLPTDTSAANELVIWLSRNGTYGELQELIQHFNEMGVPMVESTAVAAVKSRRATKEAVDIVFKLGGFPPEALGDEFWYTLFETNLTPKEVFTYALYSDSSSSCVVGPKTLQKASQVLQCDYQATIQILEMAGLCLDLTSASPPSDPLPPDPSDPQPIIDIAQNEQLQLLLLRHQIQAALDHLSFICKNNIILTHESLILLSRTFLRPRRRGKLPMKTLHVFWKYGTDVDTMIILFLALQRSGTPILWHLWSEIIRRLGMSRRLQELERLLGTLADLYCESTLPRRSRENPLRKLFIPTKLRSLMEWGLLSRDDPLWGVRMLLMLRQKGVHVDQRSVERAVRVRLGRADAHLGRAEVGTVLRRVEETWGEQIWRGGVDQLVEEVEEERYKVRMERRRREWVIRRMGWTRRRADGVVLKGLFAGVRYGGRFRE